LIDHGRPRSLIERGHEFLLQTHEQGDRDSQKSDDTSDHAPACLPSDAEKRRVGRFGPAHEEVVLLADVAAEQQGAKRGHEREREHQGAAEREHDGDRHGVEHFPLDAGQGEDGQIDERDDEHAEEHGAADLLARFMHGLQRVPWR
jgi:hypothetical protein